MRKTVYVATALAGALLGVAAHAATSSPPAKKKAAAKAATKTAGTHAPATHTTATHATATHTTASHSPAAHSTTSHTTTRKAVAKKGKKGAVPATAARSRQLNPTPDRYKEIQQALAAKGYLSPEEANGQWSDGSTAALKKFQSDQNLDASGKINSLSLIALGLGPKHEAPKPVVSTPAAPQQTPQQP